MSIEEELKSEIESVKKLLILLLVQNGVSPQVIAKAIGMSTKTIYKFIPKNTQKSQKSKN